MTLHPLHEPLRGAYCDLEELTLARFAARHMHWSQLRRAIVQQSGIARSASRGRGLEFEEVRAYQAGDDVRSIDWRVTARAGKPFTKLFREERERPMLLAVDQRQSMFFGSRCCFKAKLAAWLGAALAWTALQQGDRVGGLVFGNDGRHDIRPRHSRRAVMAWLQALYTYNRQLRPGTSPVSTNGNQPDSAADSFDHALNDLERIARPGSSIVLITDFSGAATTGPGLQRLQRLARHCEVTAIRVVDPLEQELPPPAIYTISDGERRFSLDAADRSLRERYRTAFQTQHETLRAALSLVGIPLFSADTTAPPLQILTGSERYRRSRAGSDNGAPA